MKQIGIFLLAASLCGAAFAAQAQAQSQAPAAQPQPAPAPAPIGPKDPAPGVFTAKKTGANLHLVVSGHSFTSRDDLEKYLAYRAAEQTMADKMKWFSLVEHRTKADKALPTPKGDPDGPRYSFRMEYFHPMWRYKIAGSSAWKSWSPYSGAPFFVPGIDPKTITDYQLSADVVMHPGMMDDINPLAFDASALSDFLINQVDAPK